MRRWGILAATGASLAGCSVDAPGPPTFVDARPIDATIGGISSQTLQVVIFFDSRVDNGQTPTRSDFFAAIQDLGGDDVSGATVLLSIDGGAAEVVPEDREFPGSYFLTMPGYPRQAEVDIRRGADYLEDVMLERPDVHRMTIDSSSLMAESPIRLTWEPHDASRVSAALWIWELEPFASAYADYEVVDSGSYDSIGPAFRKGGPHEVTLTRDIIARLNSQYSIAFAGLFVDELVEVAALPGDAGPLDGPQDGGLGDAITLDAVPTDALGPDGADAN